MEVSARKQFSDEMVATKLGQITAKVTLAVDPATIVAAITRSSAERLNRRAGDTARVIVTSTEAMIGK